MKNYEDFIYKKIHKLNVNGFTPIYQNPFAFDFQNDIITKTLERGRNANFIDTGLGKTLMQLVVSQNIVEKTNKNVLIISPISVSNQTIKEGEKFGIEVKRSRDGNVSGKITITNYEMLNKFDPQDFIGVVCDESSILKNFTGQTKKNITRFMAHVPYRSLWTATPSPNDFVELGTSAEALGNLKYMDMIDEFFRDTSNDKNPQWSTPKYVLKNHAVVKFWQWVAGWATACKKPSDLGFSDSDFILPELIEKEHIINASRPPEGELFIRAAVTLSEQRYEREYTVNERVQKVNELVQEHDFSVIWAHYDYETELLSKEIPDSIEISGKDSIESKEEKYDAFSNGQIKRLIIKPKIGAFGLNWQHCNHTVFFPSHSFEQYYQGVRRFWRFGQKRNVLVDIVSTEGEERVLHNIQRKAKDAEKMFENLILNMNNAIKINRKNEDNFNIKLPKFLNHGQSNY